MTQQLPLILSLIALSLGGYSVVSQPSTGAVETDDVRVQALQEEMEALRKQEEERNTWAATTVQKLWRGHLARTGGGGKKGKKGKKGKGGKGGKKKK